MFHWFHLECALDPKRPLRAKRLRRAALRVLGRFRTIARLIVVLVQSIAAVDKQRVPFPDLIRGVHVEDRARVLI